MEKIKYFILLSTIIIGNVEFILKFMLMVNKSTDLDLAIPIPSPLALIANLIQDI